MNSNTSTTATIPRTTLLRTYELLVTARQMAQLYEKHRHITSKYVHATSSGHELPQIALGMQLLPQDFVSPYYRDDALLLSIGMTPYQLMLQLLAKRDDPFSGGRTYYSHPSLKDKDKPKIIHQSSATGMQAIPATGIALGLHYRQRQNLPLDSPPPIVVCSLGDGSMTEGEVSEALQMAALKSLPILFFVQDNQWDISAYRDEVRAMDAHEYARGFKGIEAHSIDGTDFEACYLTLQQTIATMREERRPFLLHFRVPLLNHHTSGVRMEWYRDDLEEAQQRDPLPKFEQFLLDQGIDGDTLTQIKEDAHTRVQRDFDRALRAEDPRPEDLHQHIYAPTPVREETGIRQPTDGEEYPMVDCALHAIKQILQSHPEALVYGQDVGRRLGGVFRETASLAKTFGDDRVFNTPIQEAFIIGSTVGMSAVGLKPIVEVQFADYIWPGLNQLFTEVSRSYYLSNGKWPVSMVLRVPIGAYGSGGPYHSSSVETVVTNIKGIKVAYPSNGADLFGLLKAAFEDPNPVVIFEHKGLYWSKVPGTERARSVLPSPGYRVPLGKARIVHTPKDSDDNCLSVITYGMGVHWALNAIADSFEDHVEIVDLRSLQPLDMETIIASVRRCHRCLVITEEPVDNSFAQSLAARIQEHCFEHLDAPVRTIGSANTPAIPLNETLEKTMLLNAEKVRTHIDELLRY